MSNIDEKVVEKIEKGRQYRNLQSFNFETRAKEDGTDEMIVTGHACTFEEPYLLFRMGDYEVYEQIARNAFDKCDMSDVIMQYDHSGRVFARNRNDTLTLNIDDRGLAIRADLSGTAAGQELYKEISNGYIDRMSFGFHVAGEERTTEESYGDDSVYRVKVLRTITDIDKLYDVSAVSIPANDATDISARTAANGLIEAVEMELSEARNMKLLTARAKALLAL